VDQLTGALNRRAFHEAARAELLRAQRTLTPLTIAYLDIDNFKQMNDRYGHLKGDEVLVSVTKTILLNLRATDIISRLGGDEFAILLPQLAPRYAHLVLKKLQASLMGMAAARGWPISVSLGAVTFKKAASSVDEMIIKADGLMYEVKASDKGGLRYRVEPDVVLADQLGPSFAITA
jgi:diguanylate cyclase (GGDEF)-like protein